MFSWVSNRSDLYKSFRKDFYFQISKTKYGKKNCLLLANGCVLVGAGITLVENEIAIIIGRFIYGLATGSFSVLVPSFSIFFIF